MRTILWATGIPFVLCALLSGCARWDSLRPGVERRCTKGECYLIGSSEQVDRHCRKQAGTYDNGHPVKKGDGMRIRCCFDGRLFGRDRFWMARGDLDCIAHEKCHQEEFRSYRNEHWRCEGFGFGKEGKGTGYIERKK